MHAKKFIFREPYKIIKTATHYCFIFFSVFSIISAFTISTYFINECIPRRNLKKTVISSACTNNGSKIKLSTHRGRIIFPWIWRLTGITFARRKSITIARKMYLRLFFFYICEDYLLFRIYLIYS
jgi:hypothetical protein